MKPLDEMNAAEFADLCARHRQGKIKPEEIVMLRMEAMRQINSPMTMVSEEFHGQLVSLARSLGADI